LKKALVRYSGEPMNDFDRLISEAEQQSFSGWDFSYLAGRWQETLPSWDYRQIVIEYLANAASLLDLGTGGGEFLASLQPLPPKTCATEAYAPNIPIAQARLQPLGVEVFGITSDDSLPFANDSFDLIIDRHEAFSAPEVARILRPSGHFITQQVDGRYGIELNRALQSADPPYRDWSLATAVEQLERVGLRIERQIEAMSQLHFLDIGAVVYYLKAAPWQVPDFSVDQYREPLRRIHQAIQAEGRFTVSSPHFLMIAQAAAA